MLPLRWTEPGPIEELTAYLRGIGEEVDETLVVDGSPPAIFDRHATALQGVARHLPPHANLDFAMGKVNGVVTGLPECGQERVVIADDDVRYEPATLRRTAALLAEADLVRPQNYFDELPWQPAGTAAARCSTASSRAIRPSRSGTFPAPWRYGARPSSPAAPTTATPCSRIWS